MTAPELPELVRQRALANGVAGRRWIDELPERVAALASQWGLEVGPAFGGGTAAFVAAATDATGRPCVLKVWMPLEIEGPDAFARSVRVHELAAGRGCVELLAGWCGVDPEPVWQWGYVERVSTGLANLREFDGHEGLAFLEVAARCC